jgi:hypothetical protein
MRQTSTWVVFAMALFSVLVAVIAPESSGRTAAVEATCPKGTVKGVIAGKMVCLKAGQRCLARYQAQYSRYGFVCTNGRLARKPDPAKATITVSGPEEVVYDWSRDHCEDADIPNLGVHAFRDATGRVQLIIPHYVNRRMVGPDLSHLTHDCKVVLGSGDNPDYSAFDHGKWLDAPYTFDGKTIYALVYNEYPGHVYPEKCPSGGYLKCLWTYETLAVSTDGGESYRPFGPRNGLVAALPDRYFPDAGSGRGPIGIGYTSGIVRNPKDGFFYTLIGSCVMRTRSLADPTSWRAWNGNGYTVRFVDPYTEPIDDPAAHKCAPITWPRNVTGGSGFFAAGLTYNTYLERFLLVGQASIPVGNDPRWGIYYSLSSDLIHWTMPRLLVQKVIPPTWTCGGPDPVAFFTVLDPASRSRNFETSGQRPYVYYSVARPGPSCPPFTWDQDLVRVLLQITFPK